MTQPRKHVAIRVLQTLEHACGYYPERSARNIVVDPAAPQQSRLYDSLISGGFRRAGDHIFRPQCEGCRACIATRVRVADFSPSRGQRRNLKRNADLRLTLRPATPSAEVYELYRRYLAGRHPGGGMDDPSPEDFSGYLCSSWSTTRFLEFRLDETLVAVAVTDQVTTGYSAVYTFFDPDHAARGLGNYAILSQIRLAKRHHLPYVYLGYWLQDHPKMHYKLKFQPLEILSRGRWRASAPPGKSHA